MIAVVGLILFIYYGSRSFIVIFNNIAINNKA